MSGIPQVGEEKQVFSREAERTEVGNHVIP